MELLLILELNGGVLRSCSLLNKNRPRLTQFCQKRYLL